MTIIKKKIIATHSTVCDSDTEASIWIDQLPKRILVVKELTFCGGSRNIMLVELTNTGLYNEF